MFKSLQRRADHPTSTEYCARANELDSNRIFDRGNHLNSANRAPGASAYDAMAIRVCRLTVYTCIDRLRRQRKLFVPDRVSRIARIFGRHFDSSGLSAIFLLFPFQLQPLATMIAGVLAVLAPTVGPIVGGWITETYSWPWLFLINVLPGIIAALVASVSLPREQASFDQVRHLTSPRWGSGGRPCSAGNRDQGSP